MTNKILISGEGGQGIQAIAKVLISAAFAEKKKVSFLPNFGVEQRGGVSLAFVQIGNAAISFPKFQKADVAVVLSARSIKRIEQYLTPNTLVLFDNSLIEPAQLAHLSVEKMAIPASYMAKQKLTPKVFNMIILGALSAELGYPKIKNLGHEQEKYFAEKIKKEPQLKHFNLLALELGEGVVNNLKKEAKWRKKLTTA